MRRFHLIHDDGTQGAAAELIGQGVTFGDGTVVVHWTNLSVEITRQEPEQIAHGENLDVVWLDEPARPERTIRPLRVLGDLGERRV